MARTITVKGIGKVSAKPDCVVLSMTLESNHRDYDKAMDMAADHIQRLNETLFSIGFEKGSVKTTNFNVHTNYDRVKDRNGNYQSVFNGYEVTHNLKLAFDFDTDRLSQALSAIAGCLSHPQLSVAFTVKDATAINEEMLRSATANAKRKAEILCAASGVTMGDLKAAVEFGDSIIRKIDQLSANSMEKLAESGDMYAQYLMGKLWRDGPMPIPDSVNARYWFERAAVQGHLVAQYSLAKLCLSDDLEVRNVRQGMNWLYTAATNGSHYAMYRLAKECLKGENIKKDTAAAVAWFTKSAERGNQYAQYMLGKLHLIGKEVPYDEERAVYWLNQSSDQGNRYAKFLLDHLEENRPPSVIVPG